MIRWLPRLLGLVGLYILLILPINAWAFGPDEPLQDPILETRARALSKELRCVVCQNQSIDESDADLARAMRLMVRERLVAGASDAEIVQSLQDRYGDSIRLLPPFKASTYILWATPILFTVFGFWAWSRLFRDRLGAANQREGLAGASISQDDEAIVRPSALVVFVAFGVVLLLAGLLYGGLGHIGMVDQPHRPRLAEKIGVSERSIENMEQMIARLNDRLVKAPHDARAWVMLGRANRYLDRHAEAVIALKRAIAAGDESATVLADLAESLVVQDGDLTDEAKAIFARALLTNPAEPRAAFFMGISAADDGQVEAALGLLKNAAAQQPAGSVWKKRLLMQASRIENKYKKQ